MATFHELPKRLKVRGWEFKYLALEGKMRLCSIYLESIYLLTACSHAQELRSSNRSSLVRALNNALCEFGVTQCWNKGSSDSQSTYSRKLKEGKTLTGFLRMR